MFRRFLRLCSLVFMIFVISGPAFPAHARYKALTPVVARFGLHLDLTVPFGDFADDNTSASFRDTDIGFAQMGCATGGRLILEFGDRMLAWILEASVLLNGFDEDAFEDVFRDRTGIPSSYSLDVEPQTWWINIPILTGPRFRYTIVSDFGVYGTGMIGMSLLKAPDVEVTGADGSASYEYELTPTFGGAIEAGCFIDLFSVGVRLSFLGNDEVDAEETLSLSGIGALDDDYEREFPVMVFHVTLGFQF